MLLARICLAGLVPVLAVSLLGQVTPIPSGSKQSPSAIFVPLKNAQSPDVLLGQSGPLVTQRAPAAVSETQRVLLETLVREVTALKSRVAALEAAAREAGKSQPQPAPKKQ